MPPRNRRPTAFTRRLLASVVGLDSSIPAIVAALDLKLVRLIRAAIAENRACQGRGVIAPRFRHEPDPRIEPRKVIHPTPRFEPRPVIHPTACVEPVPPQFAPPVEPERPSTTASPIQPPWKLVPWAQPAPPATPPPPPPVKVVRYRPDMVHRGMMIDVLG